jgi:activator of 2-hydroxyglutaryl-CoA dehydratase
MAKTILRNASITVNGVDLSNHCSQVEVDTKFDEVDVTGYGANAKEILLGIGDGNISATFFQDFAAGSVDATLFPLAGSNTPFVVGVKGEKAVKSATNPEYKMEAVLPDYKPLSGSVGAASTTQITFRNAAQAGIERLIA